MESVDSKNKYITLNKTQRRVLFLSLAFTLIVVVPAIFGFYVNYALNRPSQTFKDLNYNLKSGTSIEKISSDLKDLGAINSENLFTIYVKLSRSYPLFRAGIYTFPAGSSIIEVVDQLKEGTNGVAITFLEGHRLEEFGLTAAKELSSFDYESFIEKTRGMEGMLFPDTYFFYTSATEDDVIAVLKDNFEKKIAKIKNTEEYAKTTLTDKEIFIIASILEKESRFKEERRIIAGILLKRLKEGIPLGIDATNQYLVATYDICGSVETAEICPKYEQALKLDWWKNSLTKRDLEIDSPFNTRIYQGLPPHPISSFSENSINAVLKPVESSYYYYLHDIEGKVRFAETLEEHNRNINQFLN